MYSMIKMSSAVKVSMYLSKSLRYVQLFQMYDIMNSNDDYSHTVIVLLASLKGLTS